MAAERDKENNVVSDIASATTADIILCNSCGVNVNLRASSSNSFRTAHILPPGFSASSLRKLSSSSELRCSISTRASSASGSPIIGDGNLYQQVRASTEGCAGRRAPPSKTYPGCGPVLQNPDVNRAPFVVELVGSRCNDGCAPSSNSLSSELPSSRRVERRASSSGFVPRDGAPDVAVAGFHDT